MYDKEDMNKQNQLILTQRQYRDTKQEQERILIIECICNTKQLLNLVEEMNILNNIVINLPLANKDN